MQVSDELCKLIGQWYVPDVEQRSHAEDVVTPLVGAVDEGTNQASDDNDRRHENGGDDVGEREAGSEEHREDEEREGDEPLDVPHILKIGGEFTSAEDISC